MRRMLIGLTDGGAKAPAADIVVMGPTTTERERDQHKTSSLTVAGDGLYLPAGTLGITTVRYVLDAIDERGSGHLCRTVRRRSSGAERCSHLSLSTASRRVGQELS